MPDFLTGQNEKNQWIRTRISNLIIHERNRSFDFKTVEQCYLRFYLLRIEISLGWATLCHFSNGHTSRQLGRWSQRSLLSISRYCIHQYVSVLVSRSLLLCNRFADKLLFQFNVPTTNYHHHHDHHHRYCCCHTSYTHGKTPV